MNNKYLLLLTMLFIIPISSKGNSYRDVTQYWQGRFYRHLTSNGSSPGVNPLISDLAFSNPAAVVNYEKVTFGFNYRYRTLVVTNYYDHNIESSKSWLPRSAGLGLRLGPVSLAIGFNKDYAYSHERELEIRTVEEPSGTGEMAKYGQNTYLYQLSLTLGSTFAPAILPFTIAYGIHLKYNEVYDHIYFSHSDVKQLEHFVTGSIGLLLSYSDVVRMGAYFIPGKMYEFTSLSNFGTYIEPSLYRSTAIIPNILTLGLSYNFSKNLELSSTIQYTSYEAMDYRREDNINYSINFDLGHIESIDIGIGLASNNKSRYKSNLAYSEPEIFRLYPSLSIKKQLHHQLEIGLFVTSKLYDKSDDYDRDLVLISIQYGK